MKRKRDKPVLFTCITESMITHKVSEKNYDIRSSLYGLLQIKKERTISSSEISFRFNHSISFFLSRWSSVKYSLRKMSTLLYSIGPAVQ